MNKTKYPLEQVREVKLDRVDKAEKVVNEKKRALEIEEDKLKKVEAERDKVLNHHGEKLTQLREALDSGSTSPEILQMKAYLKVVKEQLAKEEQKVKKQQEQVVVAENNLKIAISDLKQKRLELEKIALHKEEWEKEAAKEMLKEEIKEEDEVGTLMHQAEKRKKERGEK